MQTTRFCVFSLLLFLVAGCRTVTFRVADDSGKPVQGATIDVLTFAYWKPGEGFGEDIYKKTTRTTDKNGIATFIITSSRPNISYNLHPKVEGHYYGLGGEYWIEPVDRKSQSNSPAVNLVLNSIVNPVPMYARRVETYIPNPAQKYGYDLMAGDWVSPDGKGRAADLVFEVTGYANNVKDYDSILTVSFANPLDGIQPFVAHHGSDFISPRQAPLDGYQDKLTLHRARKPEQLSPEWIDDTDKEGNYFFRIRTLLDEQGKIKSALYGKIYGNFKFGGATEGGFLNWDYYLNPEFNSLNMEFDPERNLFRNLGGFGVNAP
jgi:hypothetical protein